MSDRIALESVFAKHGFNDFKWLDPQEIIVAQWVRVKCMFGCVEYGKCATCPPNTPSIVECEKFIREYKEAAVFHFEKKVDKPEDRKVWSKVVNTKLLEMEREVFLAGYHKAFMMPMDSCAQCSDCTDERTKCKNKRVARPGADAMGIDVYASVRAVGYPLNVLDDYSKTMNRYAFLLIE